LNHIECYFDFSDNPGDIGGHYPTYPPGMGGAPPQSMPQQQARRLDPDQMPSAIQVMEDDKKTRSGDFITSAKGKPSVKICCILTFLLLMLLFFLMTIIQV